MKPFLEIIVNRLFHLCICAVLTGESIANGAVTGLFTQDFTTLPLIVYTNDMNAVFGAGTHWQRAGTNSTWGIALSNDQYDPRVNVLQGTSVGQILFNAELATVSGMVGSTNYRYRLSVEHGYYMAHAGYAGWNGFVFNYQDENNYNAVRFQTADGRLNIGTAVGGVMTWHTTYAVGTIAWVAGRRWTLIELTSSASDTIRLRFTDTLTGSVLCSKDEIHAGLATHAGGYAGVMARADWKSFTLRVTGAPGGNVGVFSQDFTQRPVVVATNNMDAIFGVGSCWWNEGGQKWKIFNYPIEENPAWNPNWAEQGMSNQNTLRSDANGQNVFNTALRTLSGNVIGRNYGWTMRVEYLAEASGWDGLIFNYKDEDNYNLFRWNPIGSTTADAAVMAVRDGVWTTLLSYADGTFKDKWFYHHWIEIKIESPSPNVFTWTMRDLNLGGELIYSDTVVDAGLDFHMDGYGGIRAASAVNYWRMFNLTVKPPMGTIILVR